MRLDYLEHLLRDAGRLELRHQIGDRWVSGIFDNIHMLRSTVASLSKLGNLFTTINAPRLMPATNDMTGRALRDADMVLHTRLVFDFDPVRGTGQPSTDDELALAVAQSLRVVQALRALGWPMPATAVSGNGAHLVYRCRLAVSPATADMRRALYSGLKVDYSTEQVLFDTTVSNPARIWRLYGTTNRKGTPTPDRPHRVAQVLIPDRWDPVAPQLVEKLANGYARRAPKPEPARRSGIAAPAGRGDFTSLNARAWFASRGAYKRELGAGKHAVQCPWVFEHSSESGPMDTGTVIWDAEPGLWPTFHCSHQHCAGRGIRDVMARWGDADAFCAREWTRGAA